MTFRAWLQQQVVRLACRFVPSLRVVLQRTGPAIELMEERAMRNEMQSSADADFRDVILGELSEAIAISDGAPWHAGHQPKSAATASLVAARESISNLKLRETIYGTAELEIALEDRGWKRLISQSNYEFSRVGIQSIILICRLYHIKNPLAMRGVDVSAFYIFGRGFSVSSPDKTANDVLDRLFSDPRNAKQLSHTALVKREAATYTDGNLFWTLFTDPLSGEVLPRCLDALEIDDIICDPQDADTPWFYKRTWTETTFDAATGETDPKPRTHWYFVLGYEGLPNFPAEIRYIQNSPVMCTEGGEPIPVYHHKDGDKPNWKFGIPRMYPMIDWLRAYRQVLEDLCTVWRQLARFSINVETKGGAPAIAVVKAALATTLANNLSGIETNPPMVTGSAFVGNPGTKVTPVQTGSATMNPDNARRILLMVCAGFGIGEHLMGDATTGSLATAASLERPAELMFKERQEVWREIAQVFGTYALKRSLTAPKGSLREAYAKAAGVSVEDFDPTTILIEGTSHRRDAVLFHKLALPAERTQSGSLDNSQSTGSHSDASLHPSDDSRQPLSEAARKNGKKKVIIDVKFPDILTHDIKGQVDAIVEALTLGGYPAIGIDEKTGIGLLLSELGVEDVQAVLEAMYPEDGDNGYDADRTKEPPEPTAPPALPPGSDPAAEPPAEPPASTKAKPAKESGIIVSSNPVVIARAVAELRRACKLMESRMGPRGA